MDQCLRKHERLTSRSEYARCYRDGARLRTKYFTAYAYQRGNHLRRLGLAVGKAVGNAVARNRVKRQLRELFRRHKASLPEGYDVFVRAGPASAAASQTELATAWCEVIAQLRRAEAAGATGCPQLCANAMQLSTFKSGAADGDPT